MYGLLANSRQTERKVTGKQKDCTLQPQPTLPVQMTAPFWSVPELGGEVSCVSVGGLILVIWAAESRRPAPSRCRSVDSSTCSRTRSSQPLPPCHTSPTWWLRMGRLHTKQMAVIVLQSTRQPPRWMAAKHCQTSHGREVIAALWDVAPYSL